MGDKTKALEAITGAVEVASGVVSPAELLRHLLKLADAQASILWDAANPTEVELDALKETGMQWGGRKWVQEGTSDEAG